MTATYPVHREATIVLRDGSTLTVRPVRMDDAAELSRFYSALSLESRVFRFFAAVANADSSIQRMLDVDYTSRYGLVAIAGARPEIVAHAMYVAIGPRTAEMALAVADAYQGRGLGTILLGQLAEAAAAAGFDLFEAVVRPENHRMLQMLRESGFPWLLGPSLARSTRSFRPRSALKASATSRTASASPQWQRWLTCWRRTLSRSSAHRVGPEASAPPWCHNMVANGYRGPLYPVNPSAAEIEGLPAFPSVLAVPGDVEMAVDDRPGGAGSKGRARMR